MSRNPILHIKLSNLELVLKQLGIKSELAFDIIRVASEKKFQMRKQYMVSAPNSKIRKKLEKNQNAENDITEKFNMILTGLLQMKQMKNVPVIYKESKNYILLKEIAKAAHEYAVNFDFTPLEEGYKSFCELAMRIMGKKYKLEKIKYYLPKMYDMTEAIMLIEKDVNKEGTKLFYDTWQSVGSKYSTVPLILLEVEDWLHIIYARDEADSMKANYEEWITAQFEGLSFMNVIPELNQLYGVNAKKRYQKYITDKGFSKKSGNVEMRYESVDPNQKSYWDMVRKGKEKRGEKL